MLLCVNLTLYCRTLALEKHLTIWGFSLFFLRICLCNSSSQSDRKRNVSFQAADMLATWLSGPRCRILSQIADCAFFALLSGCPVSSRLPHPPSCMYDLWASVSCLDPRTKEKEEVLRGFVLFTMVIFRFALQRVCCVTLITLASVSFTHFSIPRLFYSSHALTLEGTLSEKIQSEWTEFY